MAESSIQDGEDAYLSIPRGGPIYIPEMVGPVTRVSDFEASVLQELENLCAEISSGSLENFDDDISVEELKIITDEELVNKAFEEAFKDGELTGKFLNISGEHSKARRENEGILASSELTCLETPGRGLEASTSYESLNGSSRASENEKKKRKRKEHVDKKHTIEESYIAKVEQLSRIKQKQDEDKAAARLHSFNGSSRINECASVPSEKTERMTSLKSISSTTKVRSSNVYQHIPVRYPEVILCIEIYHNKRNWVKTKELLVLGRQNLTELRDKIDCVTDEVMKKAGQHDPSGYFLIEDVFCNDLRDPSATDYSQRIFDWLRNSKKEALEKWEYIVSSELLQKQKTVLGSAAMPEFKTVDMHKTRFCDLRFRLGANYLYCHQGDCKHVIVIRDMRLIHPEDVRNRAAYPITIFQVRSRVQKCSVCKIYRAEKITIDDKWAPENPCYFCNACYYLLHYVNQSLLYSEFSVYDYFHE